MTKAQIKKLDNEIEKIYYRVGSGVAIDIMDIGKIFKAGHDAHEKGESIEEAIRVAISIYRKN